MQHRAWETEIEPWFVRNGLPYFVPSERAAARDALRPRRTAPVLLLVVLAAVGGAVALTWVTGRAAAAPATLTLIGMLAALAYALTALRARPILAWALRRTRGSVGQILPMATRALPLLLLFITFLFINAEVWQLSATLDGAVLWLTVLLFGAITVGFLLARLPEEVDRVDDQIDVELIRRATRGTPIEEPVRSLLEGRGEELPLHDYGDVPGYERWNLILVLLVTQVAQVLLLSVAVFLFFMTFGGLVMTAEVQQAWTAQEDVQHLPYLDNLSVELVQVSVFLASFSGLYFTVAVMTDETYRVQFFSEVLTELERAVGVRAGYLALGGGQQDAGQHDAGGTPGPAGAG